MFRMEWGEGKSYVITKLTEFCPIYFPVTSVQSEIVARSMLEIKNNTMRNKHILN